MAEPWRLSRAGSLRSRTPPEARLRASERRGHSTRTGTSYDVNKEQFAKIDEWDSASYRPHSESSIRYSLRLGGRGWVLSEWLPAPGCAPGSGTWAGLLPPPPARLAGAGADGARLTVVQQEQMFVELLDGGDKGLFSIDCCRSWNGIVYWPGKPGKVLVQLTTY